MVSSVYWSSGARSRNEDSLALESVLTDKGKACVLIVADGIGSLDYCHVASGYVVECFVRWFFDCGARMAYRSRQMIKRSLLRTAYDCCDEMRKAAAKNGIKWGTTCALACVWGRRYVAMNIGDSYVGKVGRRGIHALFAKDSNPEGMLIKAMGSMTYQKPTIRFGTIRRGEGILVATDGFIEKLNQDELWGSLKLRGDVSDAKIQSRLNQLGKEIEKRGGKDNRSAVYMMR